MTVDAPRAQRLAAQPAAQPAAAVRARRPVAVVLGGLLAAALATTVAAPVDERERLAVERQVVEARHADAVAACQTKFFVNDCLEVARHQRQRALDSLRQQQLRLDDARRRDRAAERLKLQHDATLSRAAEPSSPVQRRPRQADAARAAASAALPLARTEGPSTPASVPAVATRERQNQDAFDLRQQAAREHQRAVESRNGRQDAVRSPAASLPLPPASAAASP